jgi:hypothetical protein
MKYAVFPCIGLGDGLIASVLSHNLVRAGHQVDTFHPIMGQMQPLFPRLSFFGRPEGVDFLQEYDHLFFIYEKSEWMHNLIDRFPDKTTVLNPIATPNCDYPYWEQGRFDGNIPFVDNLVNYCRNIWGIEDAVRENGMELPEYIERGKYGQRVILHPTSSRAGKNWSQRQFLSLANQLERKGFEPVFILTSEERRTWPSVEAPYFKDLVAVTHFVAESGAMIGNDSGIGHLASCVGVPTLIICRSQMVANFWRPAWAEGRVIVPPSWIPNLKGMRWRDKKWQYFVPVSRVYGEFLDFRKICVLSY